MKAIITLQHDQGLTTAQVTTLWNFFSFLAKIIMHLLQPFTADINDRAILCTTLESFHAWERHLFYHESRDHRDQGIFFHRRFTPVLCLATQEMEPFFYHAPKTGLFQWTNAMCKLTIQERNPLFGTVLIQLSRFNE